ncbi:MAG TPA: tetratricopeptide repeat protein, partial [Anaerolineales bacterium]|nr:tetratricopeptide repeat protein [Anaerolineales bacterium]
GWSLEAAEAVCANLAGARQVNPVDILDLLTALVNKSLVVVVREPEQEARYHLLETVRQYAREKLSESGEAEAVREQHLAYFLALAERAEPEVQGADQLAWFDRLEMEHDNFRAALGWALEHGETYAEAGLRVANSLWWFWFMRASEGGEWLERALMATQASADLVNRAKGLSRRAWVNFFVEASAVEGLALSQTLGPAGRESMALALLGMGAWAFYQADSAQAKTLVEKSVKLFRELGYRWGICESLTWLGMTWIAEGDYPQAVPLLEESLALARRARDSNEIGFALWQLGRVAMFREDYAQAGILMEESLAIFKALKQEGGVNFLLGDLGKAALRQGNYPRAAAHYKEALVLNWERGYVRRSVPEGLEQMATTATMCHQPEQAARLFGAAEALREAGGQALHPYQLADYNHAMDVLRPQLDEITLSTLWAEGRAMTAKQAVAYALEEIPS